MSSLNSGLSDVQLARGDHLCALYSGARERNAIVAPYLAAGLASGDRCVCVVEAVDQTDLLAALGNGVDAHASVDSHQLELLTSAESYLSGGSFSIGNSLQLWTNSIDGAADAGVEGLRGAGDANGVAAHPEVLTEFAAYDSELNHLAAGQPFSIMCLWDLQRFGGEVIADLLRTHPRMILGARVIDSPYYVDPDDYLAERKGLA